MDFRQTYSKYPTIAVGKRGYLLYNMFLTTPRASLYKANKLFRSEETHWRPGIYTGK